MLLKHAMCYDVADNRRGKPRTVKDTAFVIGTGSMYAGVAHLLHNRVVIKEGIFKGKSGLVKVVESSFTDTVWKMSNEAEESKRAERRAAQVRSAVHDASEAKRMTGVTHTKWTVQSKAMAVEALYQSVPQEHREDYKVWKKYVNAAISELKLRSIVFKNITHAHLHSWYQKFYNYIELNQFSFDEDQFGGTNGFIAALEDKRSSSSTSRNQLVPHELYKLLEKELLEVVAQKIEINVSILRPYLLQFIRENEQYAHILEGGRDDGKKAFVASQTWIKTLLRKCKLSYRSITNDAGKLPANWEAEKDTFFTRIAYIIAKHKIPRELVMNMDETPLMWTPSSGKTWAAMGSDNVATQGGKDKRQATATPWVNMVGDVVFLHTTVKGKTSRSLPSEEFRNKEKARVAECLAKGEIAEEIPFAVRTKLSETKERFYDLIVDGLNDMKESGSKEKIQEHAWGEFEKCYSHQYQLDATEKVAGDTTGKYFKRNRDEDAPAEDAIISRFSKSLSFSISMSHEVIPTRDDDIHQSDMDLFVGRTVKEFKVGWPGYVHKAQRRRSSSNKAAHYVFEVKYYKGDIDITKKASKVEKYTRDQLIPLLICAEDVILVRDDEDELP
eukprot:CAMPEP_0194089798 /NCGR_PEP_ID=MMETSP0149-20130528/36321_1 /TAXON_ID=122233 /ORGANISM="Chaetoceros debilis, Strain MM31A-1" /LENGTH=613 /DNA_ID=CAMNT_0038773867 /DNA_START=213 /DNA_END=2054 /DNA_ORIENTATION=+